MFALLYCMFSVAGPGLMPPPVPALTTGATSTGTFVPTEFSPNTELLQPSELLTPVELERDLYQTHDLMLQGVSSVASVSFPLPRNWELTNDPLLHLRFGHSSTLLEDRSTMTVRINDQGIGSIALSPANSSDGELIIRVPRNLLKDYNTLTLVVDQHYTRDCEDPFDPSLWTRVSKLSTIDFAHTEHVVNADLKDFPYPIYDARGYGPVKLTVVGRGDFSKETADAAGLLAFAFGRFADYRGVEMQNPVQRVEDAKTAAILIGTPSELPDIAKYLGGLENNADQGIVALMPNPADPTLPVLIISGSTPAAVRNAALAISTNDRYQLLSGPRALVTSVVQNNPPPPNREFPLPVPYRKEDFTLADVGMKDTTTRGFYAAPIVVPLMLEGDAKVRPSGGRMRINYSYSAQLHNGLSSMEVLVNNVSLRSVPLDRPEGEERATLTVDIPAEAMSPYTDLRVVFHLYHRDFGSCVRVADRHIWGTLWSDSSLSVPRDHYADLPDLSLLRFRLWPFTDEGADQSMMVVLPDIPSANDLSAGMQLMTQLALQNNSTSWSIHMSTSQGRPESVKNRISMLSWNGTHSWYRHMESASSITTAGDLARTISNSGTMLLATQIETGYRTAEMSVSADGTSDLVLRAPESQDLIALARQLVIPKNLQKMTGNIAIFGDDNTMRTLRITDTRRVGNLSPTSSTRVSLQENWFVLVLLLPLAVILAMLLNRLAKRKGGIT